MWQRGNPLIFFKKIALFSEYRAINSANWRLFVAATHSTIKSKKEVKTTEPSTITLRGTAYQSFGPPPLFTLHAVMHTLR